jgi:hypothetical protein
VKGAGLNRWEMYLGDGTAESGGNAGSDFQLVRIDDTGTTNLGTVLAVNRATGAWTMNGTINMSGSASIGGNLTVTGTISSTAKGHLLGVAGGVGSSGAVPITDANILLYNFGANNWAGLGADGGGNLWFKAGTSGTPQASLYINATNQSVVTNYNLNVTANLGVGFLGTAGNILFGNAGAALGFNGTDFVFSNPTAVNQAPTAASHLTNKNYVDTRPGAIRAACLIDIFGGRGFSLGIAATTDAGIGYTDVSYNFAFSSLVNNCVTASISVLATNMAMNMSTPAANSIRLHAITATTAVLTDPQYYHLHATGS